MVLDTRSEDAATGSRSATRSKGMRTTAALLWVDLETSGSKPEDFIMEVAAVATDAELNRLWQIQMPIALSEEGWQRFRDNAFVFNMHTQNGLAADVATKGRPIEMADNSISALMKGTVVDGKSVRSHDWMLAGSGVSHFDRQFVLRDLPKTSSFLAYPTLDVGVLRRAFWYMGADRLIRDKQERGEKSHRALDDILDHIEEFKHYKERMQYFLQLDEEFAIGKERDRRSHGEADHIWPAELEPDTKCEVCDLTYAEWTA